MDGLDRIDAVEQTKLNEPDGEWMLINGWICLYDTDSPGHKIRIFATRVPCGHGPPPHDRHVHGPILVTVL